jgi:hypothetical protein
MGSHGGGLGGRRLGPKPFHVQTSVIAIQRQTPDCQPQEQSVRKAVRVELIADGALPPGRRRPLIARRDTHVA